MPGSRDILADLVAFDTVSRESNLALIDYVRDYLAGFGVDSELFFDAEGRKANLYATIGPSDRGGVCLSGHTDVVPADGQAGACRRSGSASATAASTGVARRT